MLDALLRNAPQKARTEREREQADVIYKSGTTLRVSVALLQYSSLFISIVINSSHLHEKHLRNPMSTSAQNMLVRVLIVRPTTPTAGVALYQYLIQLSTLNMLGI